MKSVERDIEEVIKRVQEEKGVVLKEMSEMQNELQGKKRAFYNKERAFWNNRKEAREIKKMMQREDFDAAKEACEAYNNEVWHQSSFCFGCWQLRYLVQCGSQTVLR